MGISENYIPRELLALQINYCRAQLSQLLEITKTQRVIHGKKRMVFSCGSHIAFADSRAGVKLQDQMLNRCIRLFIYG